MVSSYSQKIKKLDVEFVADVVGYGTNGITGPFEAAQGRFYQGQVIPLCVGWFGKTKKDFEKTIKVLA